MTQTATATRAAQAAADATREFHEALSAIRDLNARLRDRRRRIERAPAPMEEAVAADDRHLRHTAETCGVDALLGDLMGGGGRGAARVPAVETKAMTKLLTAAAADLVRDCLVRRLEAAYEGTDARPLSADERAKALARLDGEIFDAELAEERLIREAERAGLSVLRRADADPRALLAHDDELE